MDNIKLYNVDPNYISYLSPHAPHLFLNKQKGQQNARKYIGIVLSINGFDYFAPLSSYKEKHRVMKEGLDFIKIKQYAVINLNNMFPVAEGTYEYVDISKERNPKYRDLLRAEYRYIKSVQEKIRKTQLLYIITKSQTVIILHLLKDVTIFFPLKMLAENTQRNKHFSNCQCPCCRNKIQI